MLDYEIISSSSRGNCVRVEDMLFDVGASFQRIRKHLYGIKHIFLTHAHADHICRPTVASIQKMFPRIQWYGNFHVSYRVPVQNVMGDETTIKLKDRTIHSFPCVHDVPTHGYVIEKDGKTLIYATDTMTLEHAPKMKYDFMFIESNHDEKKIEQIRNTAVKRYGYDAWKGAKRHLSTQQSKAFYYLNRKDKDSLWVELHKSERFY